MDKLTRMRMDFYLTDDQVERLKSISAQYHELFPDAATPCRPEDMFRVIMLTGSTNLINDRFEAFEFIVACKKKAGGAS